MSMLRRSGLSSLFAGVVASFLVVGSTAAKDTAPFPATSSAPKVYVVPMKGQMGTDIDKPIYDEIVKDIQRVKPDILVMEIDSADFQFFSWLNADQPIEPGMGSAMLGEYRELVKMLRDDLAEYPQVVWLRNAMGWGSILALSWPHLYFAPDARLVGVVELAQIEKRFQDKDVAAKMLAAFSAMIKGFMEYGGYSLELGDAILLPKNTLSANFVGRNVSWALDTDGMWVVDSNTEAPTMFTAAVAEDTGLADGIAESLDDLMFLLGYREYEKVGAGESLFDKYKEDWRRAFTRCEEWGRSLELISNDDPVRAIGQQISILERIAAAMKQYPAVERRARSRGMPSRTQIEITIEQLREQLRALKSGGNTRGGGRGGNFGAPGGGGRGPGNR